MITAATSVITESRQWYALTDDRDQDARYSGGVRKPDPGGQNRGMPWSEVLVRLCERE
jgi:hypothetical protein